MPPSSVTPPPPTEEKPVPPSPVSAADGDPTSAYLHQFDEMVKLIEKLPETPELIDNFMTWQPMSFQDYFSTAAMPGRASAADVYASLNRCVRQNFEGVAEDLDRKALGAVAVIRRHYKTHGEANPEVISQICARAGNHLREVLGRANELVNQVPAAGERGRRSRPRASQA